MSATETGSIWSQLKNRFSSSRLLSAGAWVLGGNLAGQVLRFAGNLILTRLLAPEAFGLAAIVSSVEFGVELLTDIGVGQAVMSSDRARDKTFLHTAWTIKLVRGWGLALLMMLLAYPISVWFGEPDLTWLIVISALSVGLRGGSHICEFTLAREFDQKTLSFMNLAMSFSGIVVNSILAVIFRSAWALVIGNAITGVIQFGISHYVGRKSPMRLHWDAEALKSLRGFGRWVFISSTITYLTSQGDRVLLGSLLSMTELGQYALASNLATMVPNLIGGLQGSILLPLYAEEGRVTTPEFLHKLAKARGALLLLSLPPLAFLAVFGDWVVRLIWDSRYESAGWILQVLSLGHIIAMVGNIGALHFVRGETWISMVSESVRAAALIGGILLCQRLSAGLDGLVVTMAVAISLGYPMSLWVSLRYRVWLPRVDALAVLGTLLLMGLGMLIRWALG